MRKPPPRTAWFDCFSGISGDMCLGALVSAGVPLARVREGLGKLPLKGYALGQRKVRRGGLVATKVDVVVTDKGRRRWKDVEGIIAGARLPSALKKKGLDIFAALFEAEGRVHGMPWDAVHLHELGAVDCIVDVMGTLIGLEALGARDVRFSPLNVGGGETPTAHGTMPVPAPVTAELTRGLPVYGTEGPELTTPTGAVLARELASGFGPLPPFEEGALDVTITQAIMKKGRPGILFTVLSRPQSVPVLTEVLFRETTTLGVRRYRAERAVLARSVRKVKTPLGTVRVKEARWGGRLLRGVPEHEDMRRAARRHNVSLAEVREAVEKANGKG
ncbi:MAG: LarC family nickel insertion protein [Nitrospirota bacterium]